MADDIKEMTAELANDPDSLVFIRLSEALRVRGQADAASKVVLAGLERHPDVADGHDVYARILVDGGQLEQARQVWQTGLKIDPRHKGAHKGLGFLYYSRGDLDAALDHLELALAADPADPSVVQALRVVRMAADRLEHDAASVDAAGGARAEHAVAATRPGAEPSPGGFLGADHRTLLADHRGRVLGGGIQHPPGHSVADAVAAYLAGIGQEADRTARILELGDWEWLVAEGPEGNVHLTRPTPETLLLLVRDRDVPAGRLGVLAGKANDAARRWLEEQEL